MNAEAIMTPGGIADQLTRGLSGLGQSFNRREELLRQGQRDRIGDDRYTAEMALRERDRQQQIERQTMQDRRMGARDALADRRYGDQHAETRRHNGMQETTARDALSRQQEQDALREKQWYLENGAVPQGAKEFQAPNPREAFGRFADNDPPEGFGEGNSAYTPDGQVAFNARKRLEDKPQQYDRMQLLERKAQLEAEAAAIKANSKAQEVKSKADRATQSDLYKRRDTARDALSQSSIGLPVEGEGGFWGMNKNGREDVDKWEFSHPQYRAAKNELAKIELELANMDKDPNGPPRPSGAPAGPFNSGNIEDDIANGAPSFKP